MALYFTVVTWLDVALLLATFLSGWISPPSLGVQDSLHMPLGLLAAMGTLFVQAHFLSFMLTCGWEIDLAVKARKLGPGPRQAVSALRSRTMPWMGVTALGAVVTGILGMGARAMTVPGWVHMSFATVTLIGALGAAFVEAPAVHQQERLLDAVRGDARFEEPAPEASPATTPGDPEGPTAEAAPPAAGAS